MIRYVMQKPCWIIIQYYWSRLRVRTNCFRTNKENFSSSIAKVSINLVRHPWIILNNPISYLSYYRPQSIFFTRRKISVDTVILSDYWNSFDFVAIWACVYPALFANHDRSSYVCISAHTCKLMDWMGCDNREHAVCVFRET